MGEKLVIGPINKGLKTDRTAFNIDNDSFPTLINAYQWRGRIKRKRGTEFLCRLERYFNSSITSYSSFSTIPLVSGAANLISGFGLQSTASLVPGSLSITLSATVYTDDSMGNLIGGTGGTINYANGNISITGGGIGPISAIFNYYPGLPVLGIEDLVVSTNAFPGTLGFDTTYSYNISPVAPYPVTDVSFYKNPVSGSYPGYVQKSSWTATSWNGEDYQQFWTVNYQGALWATNGINIPFDETKVGMQFKSISTPGVEITTAGNGTTIPAVANITITAHGLVQGDFVFINEVVGIPGINFQTGYVTSADPQSPNVITVTFPKEILTGTWTSGGIAQYLTNRSDTTIDCLRWYDGSPTSGNPPSFIPGSGWVNFSPPLSQLTYSISDEIAGTYYLVGARIIIPFKDRLLFMGPVIQSSGGAKFYLQDTVIYSQNGTPYYTCTFNGDVVSSDTIFDPILTPVGETATAPSWFEDQTGFGGFIAAGVDQPINTAAFNEDTIIVGFKNFQTRFAYTGNDIVPFNFFSVNTEYGSSSTFSVITMDDGVITRGDRGYIMTAQTNCQRIDLEIPDQVFQINLNNNGNERFCAGRDFINEWIYFTYMSNTAEFGNFPNQTLQFNYRDNSWAIFDESYTTYGQFKRQSGESWEDVPYDAWTEWTDSWDSGENTEFQPIVLGGNQQGFILQKGVSTGEGISLCITSFSGNSVNCINHGLNDGDYIVINGCIGTIGSQVNGKIFSIQTAPSDVNFFSLDPNISTGTYFGGGTITRIYIPQIQTRQFPVSWQLSKKTRLGPQQYLLTTTYNSQITLLIFLSQNSSSPYNEGKIFPDPNAVNNGLIYSTVLYTCPESSNLGLTPANFNLQMPTAAQQAQTWHRVNTSLIGDTVQLGFTLSDDQVRDTFVSGISFQITGASQDDPCVLQCTGFFENGTIIRISGVVGMTQLNGNTYQVISSTTSEVTIDVDSTAFTPYVSGGMATPIAGNNAFSEIELHSIILDVTPSQMLA